MSIRWDILTCPDTSLAKGIASDADHLMRSIGCVVIAYGSNPSASYYHLVNTNLLGLARIRLRSPPSYSDVNPCCRCISLRTLNMRTTCLCSD